MNEEYAKEIFEKLYQQAEEETKNQEKQSSLSSIQRFAKSLEQQSEIAAIPSIYSHGIAYVHQDEFDNTSNKLSLDELRKQALELGYSLQKIEYESTDLTGTTKIKLN